MDLVLVLIQLYVKIHSGEKHKKGRWAMLQTSFGHISINSSTILMVSKTMEISQGDLLIDASHVSRQSILAEILSRSTSNHYITIY